MTKSVGRCDYDLCDMKLTMSLQLTRYVKHSAGVIGASLAECGDLLSFLPNMTTVGGLDSILVFGSRSDAKFTLAWHLQRRERT